jgi:ArsR family transcriptional regulator, arsenate/arsenite/antimonite-responsive transcriptional repressor
LSPLNELFQALSDPTRRQILRLLRQRDMTAGEIAEAFPLAFSTISGHCKVLKYAGLVVSERQGTKIVYSLSTSALEDALAAVLEMVGDRKTRKGKKP